MSRIRRRRIGTATPPLATITPVDPIAEAPTIVTELGLRTATDGVEVRGEAEVVPEACVPATSTLRTSVVATWADMVTGYVAGREMDPRIPLTLDLEVQIHRPARPGARVVTHARPLKVGRTVVVCDARFHDAASGDLLAVAHASFVASPDPRHVFPDGFPRVEWMPVGRLAVPLAERIGSTTVAPGTVDVPWRPDGLNASGAIQGGLLAFAAEEAALSLAEHPVLVQGLTVRYLRPFSVGPARAVAEVYGDLAVVHLTDAGAGKLGAVATVRLAAPAHTG
jgi:acyl-coenzyme A thioesterase PaaI-like protein